MCYWFMLVNLEKSQIDKNVIIYIYDSVIKLNTDLLRPYHTLF